MASVRRGFFRARHGRFVDGITHEGSDAGGAASAHFSYLRQVGETIYSTDPEYVSKLVRLMDRYDLGRLDQPTR